MRRKIHSLIVRSEFKLQQNDFLIAKNESEHKSLSSKIADFHQEMDAVKSLSQSLYPQGVLNKEKLLAIQRRQGVLKRKLADMKMQVSQVLLDKERCETDKETLSEKKKLFLKKIDKYHFLRMRERRERRLREVRMEESEIEERVSWQR
ncbi:hypothetical protein ACLEUK_21615 [Pseudescherichia vulneris]